MDSNLIRVNKRSQKTFDNPDLISNLPEFVISHILSFLPTKDAVRTSVLSTRWTSLWTSLMELSFDDVNLYSSFKKEKITKTSFVNSIYRVLLHHKDMSLHSFKLSISQNYDPYHINMWISALSVRKVKKIYFNSEKTPCNIPSNSLFKCHFLEELHLKLCVIEIPNVVSLSSLTVLKFSEIEINNVGNPSDKLTLNLPSLKEYIQYDCSWIGVKTVSFEVPLLEVLWIRNIYGRMPEMIFSAMSLTRLYYGSYGTRIPDLLAVRVASAEIIFKHYKDAGMQRMWNFVRKLLTTNVQHFKLGMGHPELLAEMDFVDIPYLGRLIHLELNGFPTNLLRELLLKAPCLRTLILRMVWSVGEQSNFEIVPECLYTLKVVKFERFRGNEWELNIAKFLLENAKVLERISFSYSYYYVYEKGKFEKDKEKLFSFQRSSSLAVIEFEVVV